MRPLQWLLNGSLLFVLACSAARAQIGGGLSVVPDDSAFSCLGVEGGAKLPSYPERELALKAGAIVRTRLTFEQPDAAPRVEVFFNSSSAAFADSVKAYVKQYRLPCLMAARAPMLAIQEFQFVPGDGRKVISGGLRNDADTSGVARCVTGTERPPNFSFARGPIPEGMVIVELTFTDAASAPQAKVLFDSVGKRTSSEVLAYLAGYRMPCLTAATGPLKTKQQFSFKIDGEPAYVLKDLNLKAFLGSIDELDKQSVRFDFSTMGCPFDVRLQLLRPYAPNLVGELERADPNRREFLEWLKTLSLKLPRDTLGKVIGQTTTISVPCGVLDLT